MIEQLNIYVVRRGDDTSYDETAGYVVAAVTMTDACRYGAKVSGDQPDTVWFAPTTTCTLIGRADPQTEPGIVLTDYHAG
jgi:hypothetical protein